jgi:hypothetical protein
MTKTVELLFKDSPSYQFEYDVVGTDYTDSTVTFHHTCGKKTTYPLINIHRIIELDTDKAKSRMGEKHGRATID